MYHRSHKWVDIPHTVSERRRELRVRESKHSVMIFDRKYMDIDTGKFISDKLNTINSYSLADMIDGGCHTTINYDYPDYETYRVDEKDVTNVVKFLNKKAIKLNIAEEKKKREEIVQKERARIEIYNRQQALKEKQEIREKENNYHFYLRECERELKRKEIEDLEFKMKEKAIQIAKLNELIENMSKPKVSKVIERLIYLNGDKAGQEICNVKPNKWSGPR